MLSRTASGLYWMARYLERAEQLARVLDVTHRLSLMPVRNRQGDELLLPLNLTGTRQLFETLNGRCTMPQLFNFFALDERNPSSISAAGRRRGTTRTRCAAACHPKCGKVLTRRGLRCATRAAAASRRPVPTASSTG